MDSPLFTEKEKAAIRWAELVTKNEAKYDPKSWEELKKHFPSNEIIELTIAICGFNLINRFNDTMLLEPDGPNGGMPTMEMKREKFAHYAQDVLAR